ncbi:GDSL-type esterase/lipase family protein [Nonomuraea sp. NPDC049709]|uniref:GDSL-type esterase/lipase family protein n=1 Tax=Nonomuraea sp. NPDC049709 TaxID=3154736 RepID=UPI0034274850
MSATTPQHPRSVPAASRRLRRAGPAGRVLALLALSATAMAVPAPVQAQAQARVQAAEQVAVSLGDSFISGEAGRWWGNSTVAAAAGCTRGGTDRAAYRQRLICRYDPQRVYGDTALHGAGTGCHRSDVAEITGLRQAGLTPVNLACSGAETRHIIDEAFKENTTSQADLLARVAATRQVEVVVLSIGGNDLNLSGMLRRCAALYMAADKRSCASTGEGDRFLAALPAVEQQVTLAVQKIRQVMRQAPARSAGYRLILQSYPSPVPSSARVRYSEGSGGKTATRTLVGGCPLWNADFDLMHDTLAPEIDAMLRRVATATDAEFLSMLGAVEGHALCERGTSQSGTLDDAAELGDTMEWVRYGTVGAKISQGHQQEAMHPNAFGQQALGRCLLSLYRNPSSRPCDAGTPRTQT